jgi:hypothetical protein
MQFVCFHLSIYSSPFVASTLTVVSGLFPLFLYTILLISVHHWTPALCAVHFLRCATTTARCSTLPLPLCAHPHPFDHLFTYIASYWRLRLTVHMLSSQVPWSFAEPGLLLLSYSLINQTRSSTDFWWHYHSSSVIYLSIPVRV